MTFLNLCVYSFHQIWKNVGCTSFKCFLSTHSSFIFLGLQLHISAYFIDQWYSIHFNEGWVFFVFYASFWRLSIAVSIYSLSSELFKVFLIPTSNFFISDFFFMPRNSPFYSLTSVLIVFTFSFNSLSIFMADCISQYVHIISCCMCFSTILLLALRNGIFVSLLETDQTFVDFLHIRTWVLWHCCFLRLGHKRKHFSLVLSLLCDSLPWYPSTMLWETPHQIEKFIKKWVKVQGLS